jgi:hypothetical protein
MKVVCMKKKEKHARFIRYYLRYFAISNLSLAIPIFIVWHTYITHMKICNLGSKETYPHGRTQEQPSGGLGPRSKFWILVGFVYIWKNKIQILQIYTRKGPQSLDLPPTHTSVWVRPCLSLISIILGGVKVFIQLAYELQPAMVCAIVIYLIALSLAMHNLYGS